MCNFTDANKSDVRGKSFSTKTFLFRLHRKFLHLVYFLTTAHQTNFKLFLSLESTRFLLVETKSVNKYEINFRLLCAPKRKNRNETQLSLKTVSFHLYIFILLLNLANPSALLSAKYKAPSEASGLSRY